MLSDMTAAPLLRERAEALKIVNICPFLPVHHFAFNGVYSLFPGWCRVLWCIYIVIICECKGVRRLCLLLCMAEGKAKHER